MTFFSAGLSPADNFAMVPHHWFRDPRLTDKAKGRLGYLATHAPGYRVTVEQMIAETKGGKDVVYAELNELIGLDYLVKIQERVEGGKMGPVHYTYGPAAFEQQYVRAWGKQEEVSAGEAASGFSGSGSAGSGSAGSGGSGAKKTKTKNINSLEDPPLPPGPDVTPARDLDAPEEEAEKEDPKEEPELDLGDAVSWFTHKRPDWDPIAIREALTGAVSDKLGTLRQAAVALRELAEDKHGETRSPRRLRYADGDWWVSARPKAGSALPHIPVAVRCREPGHVNQPADNCALCRSERIGAPDDDVPDGPVDPAVHAAVRAMVAGFGRAPTSRYAGSTA